MWPLQQRHPCCAPSTRPGFSTQIEQKGGCSSKAGNSRENRAIGKRKQQEARQESQGRLTSAIVFAEAAVELVEPGQFYAEGLKPLSELDMFMVTRVNHLSGHFSFISTAKPAQSCLRPVTVSQSPTGSQYGSANQLPASLDPLFIGKLLQAPKDRWSPTLVAA